MTPRTRPASTARCADFTAELGKGVKGLRIGVVRHFFETDNRASDATRAGIDAAMDFFRKEGAEVRDITLSPAADYHAVGYLIMITEAFTLHAPWMRERFMDYGELFRDRVALAAMVSGPDIVQATRRRRVLCQEMAAAMEDLDIIVSASAAGRGAAHRQRAEMGRTWRSRPSPCRSTSRAFPRSASAPASARAACPSPCSWPASRSAEPTAVPRRPCL